MNAEEAFVGTVEPEGADRLDEGRLTEWMQANVEGFKGPLHLTKFKGGQSNPTYKIEAESGNYVLRRKPFGPLLPSRMRLTANIRCRLACTRPASRSPANMAFAPTTACIGSWFYVMGMVDGRTIWNGAMPGSDRRRNGARSISRCSMCWRSCTTPISKPQVFQISANPAIISAARSIAGPSSIACPKPKPCPAWSG
jgi:hypothetical protein